MKTWRFIPILHFTSLKAEVLKDKVKYLPKVHASSFDLKFNIILALHSFAYKNLAKIIEDIYYTLSPNAL